MSAFICSEIHIVALVRFHTQQKYHIPKEFQDKKPQDLCHLLEYANRVSVNHRYREANVIQEFRYSEGRAPSAIEAYKLAQCFAYQACETDDWPETAAYRFCEYLKERAAAEIIPKLPAYDSAPWGI